MPEFYQSILEAMNGQAQNIVLGIVIVILSYILSLRVKSFMDWLRYKKKIPLPVIDTLEPIIKYSIALAGLAFFAINLSIILGFYDAVSMYMPSLAVGSIVVVITWFSYQAVKYIFQWLRTQKRIHVEILNITELVIRYGIVLVGAVIILLSMTAAVVGIDFILSQILDWLTENGGKVALIAASIIFARLISKFLKVFFSDLKIRTSFQPKVIDLASAGIRALIYLIAGLMILSSLLTIVGAGELLPLLTTVFSVLFGVGFSFAAAGALGNFIAGLVLSSWRPYDIGDRVEIGGGIYGDVMEFDILFTKIKTIKEEVVSVPNLSVLTNKIMNYSSLGACVVHSKIAVSYDYDRRRVEKLLLEAASMTEDILEEPKPFVNILELANFYIVYEVNAYTDNPNGIITINSNLHKNILDLFDKAQISLLTPDVTVETPFFWGVGKMGKREG